MPTWLPWGVLGWIISSSKDYSISLESCIRTFRIFVPPQNLSEVFQSASSSLLILKNSSRAFSCLRVSTCGRAAQFCTPIRKFRGPRPCQNIPAQVIDVILLPSRSPAFCSFIKSILNATIFCTVPVIRVHRNPTVRFFQGAFFVDYRFEDRKKLASWDATLVPLDRSWLPLSENPVESPRKTNRSARICIWRCHFKPGFEIANF